MIVRLVFRNAKVNIGQPEVSGKCSSTVRSNM